MEYSAKPNFFIVGAAKSGTSALANFLGQHHDVFISPVKEPHYFVPDSNIESLDEYLQLFKRVRHERAIGEASTGYLFSEGTPRLIKEFHPDAKIIVILRNPIEMAFSLWRYMRVHGNETMNFEQALQDRLNRKQASFKQQCAGRPENYLYLDRAKYYSQLRRYIEEFDETAVKVVIYDEFVSSPEIVCRDIFSFLDVDPEFKPEFSIVNPSGDIRFYWLKSLRNRKYPILRKLLPATIRATVRQFTRDINVKHSRHEMPETARSTLRIELRSDVEALRQLTGNDLSCWKDFV